MPDVSPASTGHEVNPYVDYGRYLTAEGGILIWYKDRDRMFWSKVWRVIAWLALTAAEAWFLLVQFPSDSSWNRYAFVALTFLNYFIVGYSKDVYGSIEIRPDGMIINGKDVFWMRYMEGGRPGFRPESNDKTVLCGIYGTRWVEYVTIRRDGERDRTPEIMAAHLQDAMRQLWERPY